MGSFLCKASNQVVVQLFNVCCVKASNILHTLPLWYQPSLSFSLMIKGVCFFVCRPTKFVIVYSFYVSLIYTQLAHYLVFFVADIDTANKFLDPAKYLAKDNK